MIEALKKIGLTDGEVKVYLALLELGNSTSWDITKKSSISGSKVYEILERLKKKGLVSYMIKNNVKYFEATSPSRILDYLNQKNKEIDLEKVEIQKIIPSLLLKQANAKKAEVKIYTGFEGAKAVFEETLRDCKKGDEMLGWGLTNQPESWESYFNEREKFRDKKGIIHKSIINEKYRSLYEARKNLPNTKFKFFPANLEMPTSVLLWKDKVSLYIITEEPITMIIEGKAVADSFRKSFEILWKNAKR